MDLLLENLHTYLSSNIFKEFCIMLNGEWGSGKTYFIKNELLPELKRQYSNWTALYVSANGLSDFDELGFQLLSFIAKQSGTIEQTKKSKVVTTVINNTIKKISNLSPSTTFTLLNSDQTLIIIDDVERINFNKIGINEFLGKLSTFFLDKSNYRILLACDEIQLLNSIDKSDANSFYKIIKEKFVYRTIVFEQRVNELIPKLFDKICVKSIPPSDKVKWDELSRLVVLITQEDNEKNLRKINFFISNLIQIVDKIGIDNLNGIGMVIVQSIYILCKEFSDGELIDSEFENAPLYLTSPYSQNEFLHFPTATTPTSKDKRSITLKYSSLLKSSKENFIFLRTFYEFICRGKMNSIAAIKQINKIRSERSIDYEWNRLINITENYEILSNEELNINYRKILEFSKQKKYNTSNIIRTINLSIRLYENHINCEFNDIESIVKFYMNDCDSYIILDYDQLDISVKIDEKYIESYKAVEKLRDHIYEAVEHKYIENSKEYANVTLEKILNNDLTGLRIHAFDNLIVHIDEKGISTIASNYILDNKFAFTFNNVIGSPISYGKNGVDKWLDNINKILIRIKDQVGTDKITAMHIKKFEAKVRDIESKMAAKK